ncbi:hypothetical protein GCM10010341_12900 [Streptomyces noursei]|nr:hypothetical protein GCM10010341_12900 [Streptomyces noursei]
MVLHGAYGTKSAQFRMGGREGHCRAVGGGAGSPGGWEGETPGGWEGETLPGRKGVNPGARRPVAELAQW